MNSPVSLNYGDDAEGVSSAPGSLLPVDFYSFVRRADQSTGYHIGGAGLDPT